MSRITIGVVLDSDFEYGVAVYEGIRAGIDKIPDWSLVPVTQSQQALLLRLAESGGLDGVIAPVVSDRWVESLKTILPAIVNISSLSSIESVSSVVVDDYAAGEMAARHFIDMGVNRVGVIFQRSVFSSVQCKNGFIDVFRKAGLTIEQPAYRGAYNYENEWEHWLADLQGEIGIFGTSDSLVRRFMRIYNVFRCALSVQISAVVGVGDSLVERTLSGMEISSVVLPAGRVGLEAVEVMKSMLEGGMQLEHRAIKPTEFKLRISSLEACKSDRVVVRARDFIERSLSTGFSVDDIAKYAGASRRKLEMRFQQELSVTPAVYVREKRMRLAERLLLETGMKVSEVAARCGAGSLQSFTSQFKLYHGLPPGKFREQAGNSQ